MMRTSFIHFCKYFWENCFIFSHKLFFIVYQMFIETNLKLCFSNFLFNENPTKTMINWFNENCKRIIPNTALEISFVIFALVCKIRFFIFCAILLANTGVQTWRNIDLFCVFLIYHVYLIIIYYHYYYY